MQLTIYTANQIAKVTDEKGNQVAKFYGPLAKTMAETFVRAMTQVAQ